MLKVLDYEVDLVIMPCGDQTYRGSEGSVVTSGIGLDPGVSQPLVYLYIGESVDLNYRK